GSGAAAHRHPRAAARRHPGVGTVAGLRPDRGSAAVMLDHRLILLATPRQIGVLDWRPGRMHWLGEFPASSTGLAAFRQLVISHAKLPMLLVVDTVDEDYRGEVLPHVQGHARNELLARKLRQVFRNARFTGTWRQARETSGRRD